MKKILSIALAAVSMYTVKAQDLKKVSTVYLLQRYEEAKTEIDKAMADPKAASNPQAWFWKAKVYGTLYASDSLRKKYPAAGEIGLEAFRKYQLLDPAMKSLSEDRGVLDLFYATAFKEGVAYFDKKQWDSSFVYFSISSEMGDIITANNWKANNQKIDTTTVLFTGYAAQNAKNQEEAVKYYGRIADLKITNVPGIGDMKDLYQYLVDYYLQKKNDGQFNKYVSLAKELFPKDAELWAEYEIEYMEKNVSFADKISLYDKADAAGTLTSNQYLAYGNIFYNAKDEETEGMDSVQKASLKKKAEDAFIKAYNKDDTNGIAAFNAGLVNYNEWGTLDDAVISNQRKMRELNSSKSTEKDPKKNTKIIAQVNTLKKVNQELEKQQHTYANRGIEWIEKAYAVLSAKPNPERIEKNVLGKSVDYLANLYQWKRDRSRGIQQADYDKYDALYKKYDALHGKL